MVKIPQQLLAQSLTSFEANQRLITDLEDFLCNKVQLKLYTLLKCWSSEVLNCLYLCLIFITYITLFSQICNDNQSYFRHSVETLSVLLCLVVNIFLLIVEIKVVSFWQKERCLSLLSKFINGKMSEWNHQVYPPQPISTIRSQVTVAGLRDGHQVNIPRALLVCGDIILVNLCLPAPTNVKLIRSQPRKDFIVLPDEILSGQVAFKGNNQFLNHEAWYKVTQAPFLAQLFQLNLSDYQMSYIQRRKKTVIKLLNFGVLPVVFCACVILHISRYFFFDDYFTATDVFLRWPVMIVLPLISLNFQVLWTISNAYGASKLDWHLRNDMNKQNNSLKAAFFNFMKAVFFPYNFLKIDALHRFGNVTAVCAVDKENILTSEYPTPEKIFFFRNDKVREEANGNNDHATFNPSNIEIISEILDITPNLTKASGLSFDDPNWHQFINSLKPIGLNVMLTSDLSNINFFSQNVHTWLNITRHCHSLSQEIGVSKQSCRQYQFIQSSVVFGTEIHKNFNEFPKLRNRYLFHNVHYDVPSCMISILYHDSLRNSNVVVSKGTADCIVKFCSDFWDGTDLQPMKQAELSAILDFFTRKSLSCYCVALAYNPCFCTAVPTDLPKTNFTITESNQNFEVHSNQVFVGMISLQYYPKPDIITLIQNLHDCGIRFIHFTAENEVRGKIFAEKLGLEAGWNCHISLSSCETENIELEGDSLSTASSLTSVFNATQSYIKAKLPKGVENVRSHLKNVDNVPLLVPLFTDCSSNAVLEMIKIMQENGEVVLCLGDAVVLENLSIFSQADVGISLLPGYYVKEKCNGPVLVELSNASSPIEVAATMNSLTSDIIIGRDSHISLHSMVIQARHFLISMQKCLLFAFGSSVSVSFLLFLAAFLFLPSPLSSGHEFYILLFIIPLFSLSILFNKIDPKISRAMPDRGVLVWNKKVFLFIFYYMVVYFPAICMCLSLFVILLNGLCHSKPDFHCHILLGNMNNSNLSDLGWRGVNSQGYIMAQDVCMFFITFYIITSSVLFLNHTEPIWKMHMFINCQYLSALTVSVVVQIIYLVYLRTVSKDGEQQSWDLLDVPWYVWLIGLLWPFFQLVLQEIVKLHLKKNFVRSQRRLRLEFQTKLGMNSPF